MRKLIETICKNSIKLCKEEHQTLAGKIAARNKLNREARKRNLKKASANAKRKTMKEPLEYIPEGEKIDPFIVPSTEFSWSDGTKEYATDKARILAIETTKPAGWYSGDRQADSGSKFLNTSRVFPNNAPTTAINFQVKELLAAANFVLVLGKRENKDHFPVFFSITEDTVKLSSEYGSNVSEIEVEGVPAPFVPCEFCINGKYLKEYLDALSRSKTDNVLLEFFKRGYPIQFSAINSKYLLMPVSMEKRCKDEPK